MRRLTVPIAAGALSLLAGLVLFAAFVGHYTPVTVAASQASPRTAIVVLTGGERRVGEGLRLFSEGYAQRVLISGTNPNTTRHDLRRISNLDATLFDCCVDLGYAAQDTIGNADETRVWAEAWGFKRLIVVTSNYHMPRSLLELARVMPDVELVAHPVMSRSYRAHTWWLDPLAIRIVVGEYLKFIPTTVRYGLARTLPSVRETEAGIERVSTPPEPATAAALLPAR
jgi:uncharacterized SAM-binding protein YcdF (DUF218 family)